MRIYERAGFTREGLAREVSLVNGTWWSAVEMGVLEHEWRAGRTA